MKLATRMSGISMRINANDKTVDEILQRPPNTRSSSATGFRRNDQIPAIHFPGVGVFSQADIGFYHSGPSRYRQTQVQAQSDCRRPDGEKDDGFPRPSSYITGVPMVA
ncbi:hypothetical protein DACRYDRAFT_24569, partial [Dacryopinax primogenitus]